MHDIISGIVPPMVTAFDHDEQIDEEALRAETKYLLFKVHEKGKCYIYIYIYIYIYLYKLYIYNNYINHFF